MEIDAKKVGQRLHAAIERADTTREKVARAAEVSTGTIQKWQGGLQQPGVFDFARAAAFLGVSVDALLGFDAEGADRLAQPIASAKERGYLATLADLSPQQRRAVVLIATSLAAERRARQADNQAPSGSRRKSSPKR